MVAAAALCWSVGGLLQRLISADAWTTVFWRAAFAALFLIAYVLWRERGRGFAPFREVGWIGLAVGFCFGAASTLYVLSLSLTQVANTLIVLSTAPFMAALLGWIILGEPVRRRTWAAIAAAFAGIALMVIRSASTGNVLGDLLAFGPPLVVAFATVMIRRQRSVRMMPAAAHMTKSSMSAGLIGAAPAPHSRASPASRLAYHQPRKMPAIQASAYQRMAKGPTSIRTGSMVGNGRTNRGNAVPLGGAGDC